MEAEQHGEKEDRKPRFNRVCLLETEYLVADTFLEDEHQQAICGADRKQI